MPLVDGDRNHLGIGRIVVERVDHHVRLDDDADLLQAGSQTGLEDEAEVVHEDGRAPPGEVGEEETALAREIGRARVGVEHRRAIGVKAYRAPAHRYVEVVKARRFADRERKDALQVLDPPLPLLLLVRPGQPAKPWQDVDRGRVLPAGERGATDSLWEQDQQQLAGILLSEYPAPGC